MVPLLQHARICDSSDKLWSFINKYKGYKGTLKFTVFIYSPNNQLNKYFDYLLKFSTDFNIILTHELILKLNVMSCIFRDTMLYFIIQSFCDRWTSVNLTKLYN